MTMVIDLNESGLGTSREKRGAFRFRTLHNFLKGPKKFASHAGVFRVHAALRHREEHRLVSHDGGLAQGDISPERLIPHAQPSCGSKVNGLRDVESVIEPTMVGPREGHHKFSGALDEMHNVHSLGNQLVRVEHRHEPVKKQSPP